MPDSDYVDYVENDSSVVLDPQNPDPVWRTANRGSDSIATDSIPDNSAARLRTITGGPSHIRRSGTPRENVDINDISFLVESMENRTPVVTRFPFSSEVAIPAFSGLREMPYVAREREIRHLDPEEVRKVEEKARQYAQKQDFESKLADMGPAERAAFLRFARIKSRNKENICEAS